MKKIRTFIAAFLIRLALLIMPGKYRKPLSQREEEIQVIKMIKTVGDYLKDKPEMLKMVTRDSDRWGQPKLVGTLQIPVATGPVPQTASFLDRAPQDFELKVVDPFEEEISNAIIDAMKDEAKEDEADEEEE